MTVYPDFIKSYVKLLTVDQEIELFANWRDALQKGETVKANRIYEKIISQYSPIAVKAVNRVLGYQINDDDLMGEALLSLSVSAQKFDPSKGTRFATYAHFCIHKDLLGYISKNYFMTNMCSNTKTKKAFFNLNKMLEIHTRKNPEATRDSALSAIADHLDMDVDSLKVISDLLAQPYQSIHQPVGDDAMLMDIIPSDTPDAETTNVLSDLEIKQKDMINRAIGELDDRSKSIYYEQIIGDEDGNLTTLTDLGKRYGISAERVRQVRDVAHTKVDNHIAAYMNLSGMDYTDILHH